MIFLGLKFWPKRFFGVYERRWEFFGSRKKTEGFFWVVPRKVVIFLGIKYEPLSDPPLSLKLVSCAPGVGPF